MATRITSAGSTGRSRDQPAAASATLVRARPAGPRRAASRARSTRSSPRGRSRRAAGSRRHVHSFEEALYVLAGRARRRDRRRRVHRLVAGDFALIPIGTWHALANARPGPGPLAVGEHAAAAGARRRAQGHVLRQGRRSTRPSSSRAPCGRGSATRPSAASATTTARRPRPRRCASTTRRAAASRPAWTRPCSPTAASP